MDTSENVITSGEAAILIAARETLEAIHKRAYDASYSARTDSSRTDGPRAQDLGRLCGTAHLAADAITHTLIVASAYLDDVNASDALHSPDDPHHSRSSRLTAARAEVIRENIAAMDAADRAAESALAASAGELGIELGDEVRDA